MTRKPDGTFAPGNPGGPGRPKRQTEATYLVALSEAVTIEDWQEIARAAVAAAKAGDAAARKWLSDYLLGVTPPQAERPTLAMAHAIEAAGGDEVELELARLLQARELEQQLINSFVSKKAEGPYGAERPR